MALQVVLATSFSATQVITTDSTGDYDAVTNPTGYGAPNDEFTDFAHYAIMRHKHVYLATETPIPDEILTLGSYDPLTAEQFTAARDSDGWYETTKLNIYIWAAGTYPLDTVRYHSGIIYKANTSTSETPGSGSEWDVVSDLTTIEDNSTVVVTFLGRTTPYNADVYHSKQIAANSQAGRCGICRDDKQKQRLDDIIFHIKAVMAGDGFGNNTDAAWNVRALENLGAL